GRRVDPRLRRSIRPPHSNPTHRHRARRTGTRPRWIVLRCVASRAREGPRDRGERSGAGRTSLPQSPERELKAWIDRPAVRVTEQSAGVSAAVPAHRGRKIAPDARAVQLPDAGSRSFIGGASRSHLPASQGPNPESFAL